MNLVVAIVTINIYLMGLRLEWAGLAEPGPQFFFLYLAQINLLLMVFNLIPLGALDGHYILPYFLPREMAERYRYLNDRYGNMTLVGAPVSEHHGGTDIPEYPGGQSGFTSPDCLRLRIRKHCVPVLSNNQPASLSASSPGCLSEKRRPKQYHPVEHKILSGYLNVDPLIPVSGIDIRKAAQNTNHIYVEKDMEGEYSGISLDHAVARICLEHTQDQLPQWSAVYPDGRIILGRTLRPATMAEF